MTDAQEEEERLAQELKEKCLKNQINIDTEKEEEKKDAKPAKKSIKSSYLHLLLNYDLLNFSKAKKERERLKKEEEERKAAEAKAEEEAKKRAKAKQDADLEKLFNTFNKFDIDNIPGLDGEEKCIIMPGRD